MKMNIRNIAGRIFTILLLLVCVVAINACGNAESSEQTSVTTDASPQPEAENEEEVEEVTEPTPTPDPHSQYTVVIDAGHQKKANTGQEKIGPKAKEKKNKVDEGNVGVSTGNKEYELNLSVALKLQKALEEKGYQVCMVRETNKVNISNKERAEIANEQGDIFIRLHCNTSSDSERQGVLVLCPTADNPYPVGKKFTECETLAYGILTRVCDKTGAENRGVVKTDYMTGMNYSKIPVIMLEMGYLSNTEEDEKLGTGAYQNKIVKGIAKGVDDYFGFQKKKKKK